MREKIKQAFEKHKQGRSCYIWKIRRELSIDRKEFDRELKGLIVNRIIQVIGGDPSSMDKNQIADSYFDDKNTLYPSLRWIGGQENKNEKLSPTDFLIRHLETVKAACAKHESHFDRWRDMIERLPAIESTMSLNTFKQQVPIILAVIQAIDNRPKEKEIVDPPKKFEGWNVHKDKKGFIRAVKRIDGKNLKSVYIGKTWNEKKAREKINLITEKRG